MVYIFKLLFIKCLFHPQSNPIRHVFFIFLREEELKVQKSREALGPKSLSRVNWQSWDLNPGPTASKHSIVSTGETPRPTTEKGYLHRSHPTSCINSPCSGASCLHTVFEVGEPGQKVRHWAWLLAVVIMETVAHTKLVLRWGLGRFGKQSRLSPVGGSVKGNTKESLEESSLSWVIGQ